MHTSLKTFPLALAFGVLQPVDFLDPFLGDAEPVQQHGAAPTPGAPTLGITTYEDRGPAKKTRLGF